MLIVRISANLHVSSLLTCTCLINLFGPVAGWIACSQFHRQPLVRSQYRLPHCLEEKSAWLFDTKSRLQTTSWGSARGVPHFRQNRESDLGCTRSGYVLCLFGLMCGFHSQVNLLSLQTVAISCKFVSMFCVRAKEDSGSEHEAYRHCRTCDKSPQQPAGLLPKAESLLLYFIGHWNLCMLMQHEQCAWRASNQI